jgi:ADP-heptose:LPS heptosyltransferase
MARSIPQWLAARVSARLARSGRFAIMRIHGSGLGDTFCMTSVMRLIHERYHWRFIVVTRFPELFLHHPLVDRLYAYPSLGFGRRKAIKWMLRHCARGGVESRVGQFDYRPDRSATPELGAESRPVASLAQLHSEHWGLDLDYGTLRNEAHFSTDEAAAFGARLPATGSYALVKSTAGSRWTPNKDWATDRFQQVVDSLPAIRWLQTGGSDEPALSNVEDLRGRTSLRELLFLVSRARFVLAPEGFYNHAAGAFDVPSFVIQSGYAPPQLAKYPNSIVIAREPQVPCAPCWLRTPCPIAGKPCTRDIGARQVIDAIVASIDMPHRAPMRGPAD